jgi:signal recognition particle GTPase
MNRPNKKDYLTTNQFEYNQMLNKYYDALESYIDILEKQLTLTDVSSSAFHNIAEEFRKWQRQWDLFGKQQITKKPPHLDEFINDLEQKYVVIKRFKYENRRRD